NVIALHRRNLSALLTARSSPLGPSFDPSPAESSDARHQIRPLSQAHFRETLLREPGDAVLVCRRSPSHLPLRFVHFTLRCPSPTRARHARGSPPQRFPTDFLPQTPNLVPQT